MEESVGDPGFDLEEDGVKAKEGDDDEDVPAVLTRSVVIGEKLPFHLFTSRLFYF